MSDCLSYECMKNKNIIIIKLVEIKKNKVVKKILLLFYKFKFCVLDL